MGDSLRRRLSGAPLAEGIEFLRPFLLHSLLHGFQHIRHYGFLGNRRRAAALTRIRTLLAGRSVWPQKGLSTL